MTFIALVIIPATYSEWLPAINNIVWAGGLSSVVDGRVTDCTLHPQTVLGIN